MAKQIDLLKSDQEKIIYRQLGKFCAYRERAESEVYKKLEQLEVSHQMSVRLIALLKKDKFLNNKRFARAYATGKFSNNKWGKIKIRQGLKEKKISNEDIRFAINKIEHDKYVQTIDTLIDKKAALLKDKQLFVFRKKIVDALRIKGYEADIVWEKVKAKFPN